MGKVCIHKEKKRNWHPALLEGCVTQKYMYFFKFVLESGSGWQMYMKHVGVSYFFVKRRTSSELSLPQLELKFSRNIWSTHFPYDI